MPSPIQAAVQDDRGGPARLRGACAGRGLEHGHDTHPDDTLLRMPEEPVGTDAGVLSLKCDQIMQLRSPRVWMRDCIHGRFIACISFIVQEGHVRRGRAVADREVAGKLAAPRAAEGGGRAGRAFLPKRHPGLHARRAPRTGGGQDGPGPVPGLVVAGRFADVEAAAGGGPDHAVVAAARARHQIG